MPATKPQPLETLVGPLVQTLPQIKPETVRCADELTNERRTNKELRNKWFITGDFPVYRCESVEGQETPEAFLYLARADKNLIFQHPDEAIPELVSGDHNYRPAPKSIDDIARDPNTLKIQLSKLNLKGNENEWRYVEINTTNYAILNDEEKKLAERIYGSMQSKKDEATGQDTSDFAQNMAMLKSNKINTTCIYVLASSYVKEHARDAPIALAGRLDDFGDGAWFFAVGWGVDVADRALRGVRRQEEAPVGRAPENEVPNPPASAYTLLMNNTTAAVEAMTPQIAAGVSNILALYLAKSAKQ